MRFSIVIPAYNGEKYLLATLESACQQTRPADEIIISDDGSTDGTMAVCNRNQFRSRIQVYQNAEGPSGFVEGWNKAINRATGDYVTLLHQDDLLEPSYLETIEKALKVFPSAKHIYCGCDYIDEDGKVFRRAPEPHTLVPRLYTGKEYRHAYLMSDAGGRHIHRCPGVTTSRTLLDSCRYRKEAGHIADDDFFYRVSKFTEVIGISAPLAKYRHHAYSETGHLEQAELSLRLAEAYTFQSFFHASGDYFDADDVRVLNRIAIRHIDHVLYCGLLAGDRTKVNLALSLKKRIQSVLRCDFESSLSAAHKAMWLLPKYISRGNADLLCARAWKHTRAVRKWFGLGFKARRVTS